MMLTTLLPQKARRRRAYLSFQALVATGVWCSGCVFFENEYDSCFNDPTCTSTETAATGDGDSMSGGPGSGGASGDGDGGNGDGDGTGDGDGDGDVTPSGGRTLGGGGVPGAGGESPEAVGGDVTSGGSGGENEAGGSDSGGTSPGNGGAPAGGETGAGGLTGGATRLVINEMRLSPSGFIEIYNASNQTLDLTHFAVTTGSGEPNWASACVLSGSLVPAAYLEVSSDDTCRGQNPCIKDCTWTLSVGDSAYVLYAEQQTFDVIVDDRIYPNNVTITIGQSYSATSDGSSTFAPRTQSPGMTNGQP